LHDVCVRPSQVIDGLLRGLLYDIPSNSDVRRVITCKEVKSTPLKQVRAITASGISIPRRGLRRRWRAGERPKAQSAVVFSYSGGATPMGSAPLQVSVKTVEKHRANLMSRLTVHDLIGLIRVAIKHGLIFSDE
jgi:hypothetical protein